MLKNKKGISFVEVLITLVIVAIIGLLSIRIQAYQSEKAIATDGVMLSRQIVDAEIAYRLENRKWCLSFAELPMKIDGEPLSGSSITPDSDVNFSSTFKSAVRTKNFVYTLKCKYRDNDNTELEIRATRCIEGDPFSFNDDSYRNGGYAFSYRINYDTLDVSFSVGQMSGSSIYRLNSSVCKYLEKRFKIKKA
ncbi:type II secretion system protein [Candidatus Ruminimicrobiellum ovillum]|uniref:type II secretion system protein n=1 Tax=Candidatus Ruminimicrobiellum ovillum TaxID=1947927 RepID=UPI00355A7AA5